MAKERKPKKETDFAITAYRVVQQATESETEPQPEVFEGKNPHAVALGRLGGLKGGKARTEKLTPEQRIELARKAAEKRWAKD